MPFYGTSEWRGLDGRTTTKRWKLQTTVSNTIEQQFTEAVGLHNDIVAALDDITEATLQDKSVSYVIENYAAGLGKIHEHALVNVWAQDPANSLDVLAISQVYVPAPVIGIFMAASGSGINDVDPSDGLLQTFIQTLSDGAYISDHEVIDVGTAVAGIENGRRVTRKIPA